MPTYEMPLLLKTLSRPELAQVLKRTAELIFKKGGFIRKIDNLGKLTTPYKISDGGVTHKVANYFIFHFDVPPQTVDTLNRECERDVDIIKNKIYTTNINQPIPCTFHEENLPPFYRPSVQEMMLLGKKQKERKEKKKRFRFNTGLDYYPFQR